MSDPRLEQIARELVPRCLTLVETEAYFQRILAALESAQATGRAKVENMGDASMSEPTDPIVQLIEDWRARQKRCADAGWDSASALGMCADQLEAALRAQRTEGRPEATGRAETPPDPPHLREDYREVWASGFRAGKVEGRDESAARIAALEARASTLEDAAFHFQTCRICRADGEFGRKTCIDGQAFDAFFRGDGPLVAAQGAPTRAEGRWFEKVLAISGLVNTYHNDGTTLSAAETLQAIAQVLGPAGGSLVPMFNERCISACREKDRLGIRHGWCWTCVQELRRQWREEVVALEAALESAQATGRAEMPPDPKLLTIAGLVNSYHNGTEVDAVAAFRALRDIADVLGKPMEEGRVETPRDEWRTDKRLLAIAKDAAERAYENIRSVAPHGVPQLLIAPIYAALSDAQKGAEGRDESAARIKELEAALKELAEAAFDYHVHSELSPGVKGVDKTVRLLKARNAALELIGITLGVTLVSAITELRRKR